MTIATLIDPDLDMGTVVRENIVSVSVTLTIVSRHTGHSRMLATSTDPTRLSSRLEPLSNSLPSLKIRL